jgi:hypothetical protein
MPETEKVVEKEFVASDFSHAIFSECETLCGVAIAQDAEDNSPITIKLAKQKGAFVFGVCNVVGSLKFKRGIKYEEILLG